jgi:hypothetical protein
MLSFVAWNQAIEMLLAKRFTLLAIVLLGVALLEGGTPHQRIDVVIHSTYFVIAHIHVLHVQALVRADLFRCRSLGSSPAQEFSSDACSRFRSG